MNVQQEFRKRFLARRGFYSPGAKNKIITTRYETHENNLQSKNSIKVSKKKKRMGDKPKGTKEQRLKGNSARMAEVQYGKLAEKMIYR